METIERYNGSVQLNTDASQTAEGRVGIGCHIHSDEHDIDYEHCARITDGVMVYSGEMTALRLALERAHQLSMSKGLGRFAIFTDSSSSVKTLKSSESKSRPNLHTELIELIHTLSSDVTIIWVPSHIGISGNERADQLAGKATMLPNIEMHVFTEKNTSCYSHR